MHCSRKSWSRRPGNNAVIAAGTPAPIVSCTDEPPAGLSVPAGRIMKMLSRPVNGMVRP